MSRNSATLAVGENHGLFQHMIDGLAVDHAARAGGIVGHHAADGGAAGGGDIGREAQPQGRELRVQLIQDNARLDACPAFLHVHFEHAVVILRYIDLQAFADGLSGLRRPASAHGDGATEAAADFDDAHDIVARLRDGYADGADLIDARVGGIERAGDGVEADLAGDGAFEFGLQGGGDLSADTRANLRAAGPIHGPGSSPPLANETRSVPSPPGPYAAPCTTTTP